MNVGEVAASAAGDAYFFADDGKVFDEQYAPAAPARLGRAHHAGSAGTDHDDVVRRGTRRSQNQERFELRCPR